MGGRGREGMSAGRRSRWEAALEAIGDGDQDVMDTARLQIVKDFHPEFCTFGVLDPDTEDVAAAVGQHAQGQVHGLGAHHRLITDLDPQRVEEHDRVHRLQRAALPGRNLAHDGVGDAADEVGRDVYRIHLSKKPLDLAHRHAACVHGNNFVVKAGEATLMLTDELRLKRARAVAGHIDAQGASVGQHGLGALAIAMISGGPLQAWPGRLRSPGGDSSRHPGRAQELTS